MKTKTLVRFLAGTGTLVCVCLSLKADPLDQWHWRNPVPTGDWIYGVAHANGLFVASDNGGSLWTSPDGIEWTRRHSGAAGALTAVAQGRSTIVAVCAR